VGDTNGIVELDVGVLDEGEEVGELVVTVSGGMEEIGGEKGLTRSLSVQVLLAFGAAVSDMLSWLVVGVGWGWGIDGQELVKVGGKRMVEDGRTLEARGLMIRQAWTGEGALTFALIRKEGLRE
jgi:hypothetical protein